MVSSGNMLELAHLATVPSVVRRITVACVPGSRGPASMRRNDNGRSKCSIEQPRAKQRRPLTSTNAANASTIRSTRAHIQLEAAHATEEQRTARARPRPRNCTGRHVCCERTPRALAPVARRQARPRTWQRMRGRRAGLEQGQPQQRGRPRTERSVRESGVRSCQHSDGTLVIRPKDRGTMQTAICERPSSAFVCGHRCTSGEGHFTSPCCKCFLHTRTCTHSDDCRARACARPAAPPLTAAAPCAAAPQCTP